MKKFKKDFLKNKTVLFNRRGQVSFSKQYMSPKKLKFYRFISIKGL